ARGDGAALRFLQCLLAAECGDVEVCIRCGNTPMPLQRDRSAQQTRADGSRGRRLAIGTSASGDRAIGLRLLSNRNASRSAWKVPRSTTAGAEGSSLMKSVIVLSVSAWRCFHFPEVALDLTVSSHVLRHRLSFPRGLEITVRQNLLLAMLRASCNSTRA